VRTPFYEPDQRSGAWVKFKLRHKEEFVIGGYTLGQGNRSDFGALIVGYYQGAKLVYASKVGTAVWLKPVLVCQVRLDRGWLFAVPDLSGLRDDSMPRK
jgi:bifunctional non-homologous end joining protein LigD